MSSSLRLADATAAIARAGFGPCPFGTGLELEWFVTDGAGRAVTDVERIRSAVTADGPLPAGSRVTFEPGGQLEISTPCADSGPVALASAGEDALAVRARLARHDLRCVAAGVDAGGQRPRVLDEPRYRAMAEYFARRGCAGATMMRNTAALQANVGFARDVDAQWSFAHDLAPVVAAMFANSPLLDGRPTGWQSTRLATWAALDPARTAAVGRPGTTARDAWTTYALDAPVMLVHGAHGCDVPRIPTTLREWIAGAPALRRPAVADVEYHLTTLFPPVRPRGWIELRVLDALGDPWWTVAAAVVDIALGDDTTRATLAPILAGTASRMLIAAWHGVHDPTIAVAARAVLDAVAIATDRCGYPPEIAETLAEFRARFTDRGRSPADDLLDGWWAGGRVAPDPEPVPVGTR
jgi:ergothioneine biosynthesis glutamate--cysteine ligase EgtA